jgi:hypothetical protein
MTTAEWMLRQGVRFHFGPSSFHVGPSSNGWHKGIHLAIRADVYVVMISFNWGLPVWWLPRARTVDGCEVAFGWGLLALQVRYFLIPRKRLSTV